MDKIGGLYPKGIRAWKYKKLKTIKYGEYENRKKRGRHI